jgi:hypothetical protein
VKVVNDGGDIMIGAGSEGISFMAMQEGRVGLTSLAQN